METAFLHNIEKKQLFSKETKLLLGVSGGRDSMALAQLLSHCGYEFTVAHCNFTLRGAESDKEEKFVIDYFSGKNIKVYTNKFDTTKYAEIHNCSIQMAARELRYQWFNELKDKENFDFVVTAHHANDNIETFFINLLRGAGLKGLAGIPEKTERVVRPLLFASREQIDAYIDEHQIPFCEDSSNAEEKYLRNKLRHQLMPLLKELNPSFEDTISREMSIIQSTQGFVEKELQRQLHNIACIKDRLLELNIEKIISSDHPELLLHEALKDYGFRNDIITQIKDSLEDHIPGKQFKSASHLLVIDRESIIVGALTNDALNSEYPVDETGITAPIHLSFEKKEGKHIINSGDVTCLDLDKLKFPLRLCRWQEGDFFVPLGMKGRKKLSDFFVNEKMNLFDKQNAWILKSGMDVVWVIGRRTDDRFKVTDDTKNTLIIEWKK